MNREITPAPSASCSASYRTELSSDQLDQHGQLLDRVISFAFDTLGASRLDLRVTPSRFPADPDWADPRHMYK